MLNDSMRWLTVLLLVGCTSSSTMRPVPPDDELLVATAALIEFVGEPDSVGVLMLHHRLVGRTRDFPDSAAWTAAMDSFGLRRVRYPTLVARYWTINRHPRRLRSPLQVPGWSVQLVDQSGQVGSGLETVHYVSRVGLSPSGDSAIVAVDAICGPLCGRGVLALYVRRVDGWKFTSTLQRLQY